MNKKILSMLDTTKKKAGAVVLSTALVTALGVSTVFAANSINFLQVKMENGVKSYSTDNGKTWSQDAPYGMTVNDEEGKLTISNGDPSKLGEGKGILTKMEDGIRYYSTDGGKTWSQDAPYGVTARDENGKITISNGAPKDDKGNSLLIKMEDGIRNYSTDGGKTWSKTPPKSITVNEDGAVVSSYVYVSYLLIQMSR